MRGKVLVTGASGFIGRTLTDHLASMAWQVRACSRTKPAGGAVRSGIEQVATGAIEHCSDWEPLLKDMDTIVHLAAIPDLPDSANEEAKRQLFRVNVNASRSLFEAAGAAGVKRFVFLSSIKVNGETTAERPFDAESPANPTSDYGRSKLAAEQALASACENSSTELVILRPALVYGPNSRGNLDRLMKLIAKRIPLPLGGVQNHRSMLAIDNLCELIGLCLDHPDAAGNIFLAADPEPISTPELIRQLAVHMRCPARLPRVPPALLQALARATGKRAELQRLTSSLVIDSALARDTLGWTTKTRPEQALRLTAEAFVRRMDKR